jgi:type 1 fimbriae regulatory protein FimB/type 1 fimbriae regulatory protein FimE
MGTTVPPKKPRNKDRRSREYLTPAEVEKLIKAAKDVGRNGHRDATMILLAYRHGFRVSELVSLRWDQVDLKLGLLHVHRRKHGIDTTHPLYGVEIRALRQIRREKLDTQYVFVTERKGPLTASTFRKMVARAGKLAGIEMPVHPHMLRHATGFKLANDGRDTRTIQHYLGHRNIQHTVVYTELSPSRFNALWEE